MAGVMIEPNLRPCHVTFGNNTYNALFHLWSPFSDRRGDRSISQMYGIVELEDGRVIEVLPRQITFIDNKHQEYCFNTEKREEK